ncbi:hypothetical protein [Clostridium sp.]|uniref:hypothetical protein n=1 Tax=Clostridium sp. TaxID=1506 RepID=UPI0025C345D1|nr:hypothetical protein [Clostridium sp.]MCI9303075.1 hypothetical protein [Clostridium sp.]
MKDKERIVKYLIFILIFNVIKNNFDFCMLNPKSYYSDYFNKTTPKEYESVPSKDLNSEDNNINKIEDFHYYFDDYDYYDNYKDFKYYDKKDDYYDHNYYEGYE